MTSTTTKAIGSQSQDVFVQWKTNINKCSEAETETEKWLPIFKDDKIQPILQTALTPLQKFQRLFGYGSAGYRTLCWKVEQTAKRQINALIKLKEKEFDELFARNSEQSNLDKMDELHQALRDITQIETSRDEVIKALGKFFPISVDDSISGRVTLVAFVILQALIELPWAIVQMFTPITPADQFYYSTINLHGLLLKPYSNPSVFWSGTSQNGQKTSLRYSVREFTPTHNFEILKGEKVVVGATVILHRTRTQQNEKTWFLSTRVSNEEETEAKFLFARFLTIFQEKMGLSKPMTVDGEKSLNLNQRGLFCFQDISIDEGFMKKLEQLKTIIEVIPVDYYNNGPIPPNILKEVLSAL